MTKELILLLGGARSGKSALAERLAAQGRRVLFVATAERSDEEMTQRIALHRSERPSHWETLEEPVEIANGIRRAGSGYDTVLVDCLTLWVSNLLERGDGAEPEPAVLERVRELVDSYEAGRARWIVVSNEVGAGIVPASGLGRRYRDVLGRVNQRMAACADKVYLVSAGLALELKALGAQPVGGVDGPD